LRNRLFNALLATAFAVCLPSITSAATITVNQNTGTVQSVGQVNDHEVDGDEMDGMIVSVDVRRNDGQLFTLTRVWGDTGSNSGGVDFGGLLDDFDLNVSGDTFNTNNWELDFSIFSLFNTYSLVGMVFNGLAGNTVFDRTFGGSNGTTGSDSGKDFAGFSNWQGNITATYSNAVQLGVNAPVGDLFANFMMQFGNGTFGQGLAENNNTYKFSLDTDHVRQGGPQPVPEPTSLVLLGSGLIAAARQYRKRKTAA
jgi:hypothetical protein